MNDRASPLLLSILCIGIAILYVPILVLIGYSFNASALVSVEKVGSDVAAPSVEKQDSDDSYFETQFKLITSETQLRRVYGCDLVAADSHRLRDQDGGGG